MTPRTGTAWARPCFGKEKRMLRSSLVARRQVTMPATEETPDELQEAAPSVGGQQEMAPLREALRNTQRLRIGMTQGLPVGITRLRTMVLTLSATQ